MELPLNYLAFVLPTATQAPAADKLDQLRLATIGYLEERLQADFPAVQSVQLQFTTVEFGTRKPAARFNLYLEAKANVSFINSQLPDIPSIFQSYVSSFTEDYLDRVVRPLDEAPLLQEALEVRARKVGPGTPAGAVHAPKFYMAFVVSKEPKAVAKREQDAVLKDCHEVFTKLLRMEFEDEFDKLTSLNIVKTAVGEEAQKPEPRFNVYFEFEAVGYFHKNPPEPMDFFRALAVPPKELKSPYLKDSAQDCPTFVGCEMVIRTIYVEKPIDDEAEPKDGDAPEDDGDPDDDGPDENKKTDGPPEERLEVKMELGFHVALVIPELKALPDAAACDNFDALIHSFFSAALKANHEDSFVDMELVPQAQFEAGVPLPRFNLLHQYDATLYFYHPPPDETDVQKEFLYVNTSDLYTKIQQLGPPQGTMIEYTLGRALEKQVTDQAYGGKMGLEELNAKRESIRIEKEEKRRQEEERRRKAEEERRRQEEARRKAEEERKRKEAQAKALAEKKRKEEEEARQRAAEEKKRQEAAAAKAASDKAAAEKAAADKAAADKAAAEKKKQEEEAARKAAEEEKARQEAEAKAAEEAETKRRESEASAAKRDSMASTRDSIASTRDSMVSKRGSVVREPKKAVRTADVFMAYTLPRCKREPNPKAFEALAKSTQKFYKKRLKKKWKSFVSVDVAVHKTHFGRNIPDERYQIYVEWDVDAKFDGTSPSPDRHQLCSFFVHDADLGTYITDHLLKLTSTPFHSATGVFTEHVSTFKVE